MFETGVKVIDLLSPSRKDARLPKTETTARLPKMDIRLRRWQRILLLAAVWALLAVFLTPFSATAQTANSKPAFPSSEDGDRSVAETPAAPGVTLSKTAVMVDEGGNNTYTVVLDVQPSAKVVISLRKSGSADVTATPTKLTFTTSNWSTAQTMTVAAAEDADAVDEAASIAHYVEPNETKAYEYHSVFVGSVAVSVDDDDAGVTVSASAVTVDEGGSVSYTVVLDAQPSSFVAINVTKSGSGVRVDPSWLVFYVNDWNTPQKVLVRAPMDADAVDDTASIAHSVRALSSADEYDAVSIGSVAVTVDDDDVGVTVSESAVTVDEGVSGSYTAVLDAQPASDVVIAVSSDNADVTVSPATLTFTRANWDTAQTVTVAAGQDADAVNDAASITHAVVASSSANEYDRLTIGSVAVTVTDDDDDGVTVSESAVTVAEGGRASYTVVLDAQPTSDVVISLTRRGSSDVTLSPATLTFTTSNWSTAQTVTVAAAEDTDGGNDTASIAHAVLAGRSADEYDTVKIAALAVTVRDNEFGVFVSVSTLVVQEGVVQEGVVQEGVVQEGDMASYTVVLNAQPTSNVLIHVTSDYDHLRLSPAFLTFTTSNWDTAQTVTVTADQDGDAVDDTATIDHAVLPSRSADEYDTVTIGSVAVTVVDDDIASVTVSESAVTVAEGATDTYTVKLKPQLSSVVVVAVSSDNVDVTVSPATLIFTTWTKELTVTVAAAHDADTVDDTASITHTVLASRSADEFDAVSIGSVEVTVTDDDEPPRGVVGGGVWIVGPPNQTPTFASRTVGDLIYTVGEDLGTVSLPPAIEGDGGLRYSLSPGLPPGLRFNSERTITGTPSAALPRTRFTYTATDSDGDSVDLRFFVTVNERPATNVASGAYDVDKNEVVDRDETIAAVADYFASRIAKDEVLAVIQLYFSG